MTGKIKVGDLKNNMLLDGKSETYRASEVKDRWLLEGELWVSLMVSRECGPHLCRDAILASAGPGGGLASTPNGKDLNQHEPGDETANVCRICHPTQLRPASKNADAAD